MIVNVKQIGNSDGKTSMKLPQFSDGKSRHFYVRFYEAELEAEFHFVIQAFKKRGTLLEITEKNGTYLVREEGTGMKGEYTHWDILMHKYFSLSQQIRKDNGEKYYPIRMSDTYIEPCGRKLAV